MSEPDPEKLSEFYKKLLPKMAREGHLDCIESMMALNQRVIERDKRIKELEDAGRTLMARLQTSEIQAIKGAARVAELKVRLRMEYEYHKGTQRGVDILRVLQEQGDEQRIERNN